MSSNEDLFRVTAFGPPTQGHRVKRDVSFDELASTIAALLEEGNRRVTVVYEEQE